MTAILMGRSMLLDNVTSPEKFVLVAIADNANEYGTGYLLIETLARKTSLNKRTVQNAINALIEKGLLQRRTRYNRSSIFRINVAALPEKSHRPSPYELSEDDLWSEFEGEGDSPPRRRPKSNLERGAQHLESHSQLLEPQPPINPIPNLLEPSTPISPQGDESDLFADGGQELGPVIIPDLTDQEIGDAYVERWNRLCDEEEKLDRVDRFSADRQKELILRLGTRAPAEVGILLDELFRRIAGSRWLRGRGRNSTWKASWSWVLKKMNFNKIMEGQYVQDFDSENPDASGNSGDRSHGQAGRDAARIIDAMRGRA